MKYNHLLVSLAVITVLHGCGMQAGSTSGHWTAEINPDSGSPSVSQVLGEFPSYDACVMAALTALGGSGIFNCSIS